MRDPLNYNSMVSQARMLNLYHSMQRDATMRGAATPCASTASMPNCSVTCAEEDDPFLNFDHARFPVQGAAAAARRHGAPAPVWVTRAWRERAPYHQNCEVTALDGKARLPG
jgi:sarcosine oxidase subunit beta